MSLEASTVSASAPLVRSGRALLGIYGVTVFLGAGLLFLVQPMVSKMLLPHLGGSPAVWNTCMCFFQAALLLGYFYAHWLSRHFGGGAQAAVHCAVLGIAALASALMSLTNFGNWIKSTGGHLEAAASMGIPVNRVKIICFMLCSVLAGFAGLIQVLRLNSPLPSIGLGMELQAVAAAVIGGTALTGGVGTVFGAIVGALLIRVIDNGLVLSHVNANWFQFAIGALTVIAVIANSWLRRTARRIKVQVDNEPAHHRVSRPA